MHLGNRRLLTFIGRSFYPCAYESGGTIYRQGDEIQSLMIASKGIASFVHQSYGNSIYAFVAPTHDTYNKKVLEHFGFEDSIVNHLKLIKGLSEKKITKDDLEAQADRSFLSTRYFSVQCIVNMECLEL